MVMERELAFVFRSTAPKLVCGRNAIASLWDELEILSARRAMIICGPNILSKSNVIGRVQEALREKYVGLFSEVQPHSPLEIVPRGAEAARQLRPDVLISVGGGSTHDTAKGIVTVLAEGKDLRECMVEFEPPDKLFEPDLPQQKMPRVAVTTTFGCSEFGGRGGFSDRQTRRKLIKAKDEKTISKVVIIDGLALATTPVPVLQATGLGQLRVCIETVYSKEHNPISDALALHGIKLLKALLPSCGEGDTEMLMQTKIAASLPYLGPSAGAGLNTALGHQMGAICSVAHGVANAIMLPHTMRYNLEASAERQALIAQALGVDTSELTTMEAGLSAADAMASMLRGFGLPTRLRDIGVRREGLGMIAEATMHDFTRLSNPRAIVDQAQVLEVLHKAW
ncbi:MAG: iron-containing alcohol dehydrogenase [Chloroflexi bacterium]|nr:iron-containing alcohol dehydrogenase [Chloroflexota bacterium]